MRFFVNHAFLFRARRADQKKKHGARFFFCSVRGGPTTFNHSLARPGVIHSLTGASGGAFFFAPCAVGEIHSLTGASAAVCGWNRGRVFFLLRARRAKQKKKTRGAFFFVRHAAGRAKKTSSVYYSHVYINPLRYILIYRTTQAMPFPPKRFELDFSSSQKNIQYPIV